MISAWGSTALRIRIRPPLRVSSRTNYQSAQKDYYSILGVPHTATQREIKSAYYTLSKKYHPDVAGSSAESKFLEINEAYECLRDSERRRHYDNMRTGARGPRYTGDHGYQGDPFEEFYRRATQQQTNSRGRRYSQQDYERIWQEFRRQSHQRNAYDSRVNWERQQIWEELARRRAERWKEFQKKYPDGPPGNIKWKWNFQYKSPQGGGSSSADLLRRIALMYAIMFGIVTVAQLMMQSFGGPATRGRQPPTPHHTQEEVDHQRILQMMEKAPQATGQRWEPVEEKRREVPEQRRTLDYQNQMPHIDVPVEEKVEYPYGMPTNSKSY